MVEPLRPASSIKSHSSPTLTSAVNTRNILHHFDLTKQENDSLTCFGHFIVIDFDILGPSPA